MCKPKKHRPWHITDASFVEPQLYTLYSWLCGHSQIVPSVPVQFRSTIWNGQIPSVYDPFPATAPISFKEIKLLTISPYQKFLPTKFWISKLFTNNTSIFILPKLTTYGTPSAIYTDFNSSKIWTCSISRGYQTDLPVGTYSYKISIIMLLSWLHDSLILRSHLSPTSRPWLQYITPPSCTKFVLGHSNKFDSDPWQPMLLKNTGSTPAPNALLLL